MDAREQQSYFELLVWEIKFANHKSISHIGCVIDDMVANRCVNSEQKSELNRLYRAKRNILYSFSKFTI